MVLKGAFLHHFASNKDATKRVRGRKGIMKDPGMKEIGQKVSDKARTTIVIAVKLKRSWEGLSFLCAVILTYIMRQ